MKLTSGTRDGVTVITVDEPRIDAAVAIRFKDEMRALTDGAAGPVILDLGQVDFIDSSGLGAIVAALKLMPEGRALELAALTPNVDRVFRLTRMDSVFRIHEATGADAGRGD
ncbi:anti-sigma factor antagonist [Primorskyibacter flagellatus]|uniref:Anti-sigma factor antagonist n=1 Tax=Primorskyibacter flagellatus TaxID=1387277 RepID=A0A917ADU2_9RHOB|nr:STAS domain-containing protein [Primorskyibacter flagellatus]GGE45482.1 anti-sigma factor antagonist [Primorskyibacter flagellatus]